MIDFIKIQIFDLPLIEHFRQHTKLDWMSNEDRFDRNDCEVVRTKLVRTHGGIKFCFYNNRLDILFKPHFYFNNDKHNANNFSMNDCIGTIEEFGRNFEVDLKLLPVVNLEYGINVISPIDIRDLISYLYSHERNEFRADPDLGFSKRSFRPDGRGKANVYKVVKCYAKGIQQPGFCHPDTLRFEIKSQMRKFIRQHGIITMEDLLNTEVYSKLGESIIKEFEHILMLDLSADLSRLSSDDRHKLSAFLNTMQWFKILQKHRNAFARNKQSYYLLLDKTGNHLKSEMSSRIQTKVYELIS